MMKNIGKLFEFLDELQVNAAILIGGFYGLIVIESDIKNVFKIASKLEDKKRILEEAQNVVTSTLATIADSTTANKEVLSELKKFPDEGRKHAIEEHVKFRERILIDMEAYVISLESKIDELKNEI